MRDTSHLIRCPPKASASLTWRSGTAMAPTAFFRLSYFSGALRRPLLEDGYEPLQSADEPEGAERGAAFVRQLLFEVLFAEFVDIAADVTNVRGLPASALRAHARFPSLQFVRDARPAFLCLE